MAKYDKYPSGLYKKHVVTPCSEDLDGDSNEYFVLTIPADRSMMDIATKVALTAYAKVCESEHPELAQILDNIVAESLESEEGDV